MLPQWFAKNTSLWFVDFMQQALYNQQEGYYTRKDSPFGKKGDFITAPEITSLFGQTLANVCGKILPLLHEPVIVEFGAGSGRLCVDILTSLEQQNLLPHKYLILELSHALKITQEKLIKEELGHLISKVEWITAWPKKSFQGIIVANEVLDAMPVHRFKIDKTAIFESKISCSAAGDLKEIWQPCPHKRIIQHIKARTASLDTNYISECNGLLDNWVLNCSKMLKKGVMLIIDYGFPAREYYHQDRNQGTLMCHYKHHAHTNFLANIGDQDITAHVDFTHVAEAANKATFDIAWFSNQAAFLLENGILDFLSNIKNEVSRFKANQALMQLLSPAEMGELFKAMVLTKNISLPFTWQERYTLRT